MARRGIEQYDRLTFSMNPNDPDALLNSRALEGVIKSMISQIQKEGEGILRSQRYTTSSNMRATDYYIPQGFGEMVRAAFITKLADIEGKKKGTIGVGISSVFPSAMRTQTATVHDAHVRAEIARVVKEAGGKVSIGKEGTLTLGIPQGVNVVGTGSKPVSLSRSVSGRIAASNTAFAEKYQQFVAGTGISDMSVDDVQRFTKIARGSMSEREFAFSTIAKRGRMSEYRKQYEKEHPDDPVVASRRAMRKSKAFKSAVKSVGRGLKKASRMFGAKNVLRYLGSLVGGSATTIGVLKSIFEITKNIGENLRRSREGDIRYNFEDNTTRQWEEYARARDWRAGLLGGAAGELQRVYLDPLHLSNPAISAIAPYVGGDAISSLVGYATKGGDVNMKEMIAETLNMFMGLIRSGKFMGRYVGTGDAARRYAQIAQEGFGGNIADLLMKMYNDEENLIQTGGAARSGMEFLNLYKDERYRGITSGSSGISTETTRQANDEATSRLEYLGGLVNGLKTDIFDKIYATLGSIAEWLIGTLGDGILGKWFPRLAMATADRARDINKEASFLVNANMDPALRAVNAARSKYGIPDNVTNTEIIDAISSGRISSLGLDVRAANALRGDTEALTAIATYERLKVESAFLLAQEGDTNPQASTASPAKIARDTMAIVSRMRAGINKTIRNTARRPLDILDREAGSLGAAFTSVGLMAAIKKMIDDPSQANYDALIERANVAIADDDFYTAEAGYRAKMMAATIMGKDTKGISTAMVNALYIGTPKKKNVPKDRESRSAAFATQLEAIRAAMSGVASQEERANLVNATGGGGAAQQILLAANSALAAGGDVADIQSYLNGAVYGSQRVMFDVDEASGNRMLTVRVQTYDKEKEAWVDRAVVKNINNPGLPADIVVNAKDSAFDTLSSNVTRAFDAQ